MAHGTPDWSSTGPSDIIAGVVDLGELAVRLGSPNTLERKGNVVLLNPLTGAVDSVLADVSGAGSYIELSRKYHRGDGWAVHLCADGTAGAYVGISQLSSLPVSGLVGVEFDASFNVYTQYAMLEATALVGTLQYKAKVRLNYPTNTLEYYNDAGVWTTLASDVYPYPVPYVFHCWKLVIDLDVGKYNRFILNDTVFPMTQSINYVTLGQNQNLLSARFSNWSQSGYQSESYVDCAIFTINEP